MKEAQLAKPVEMLEAFSRDEAQKAAEVLSYPDLEIYAQQAKSKDGQLFNEFVDSEPGTLEEEDRARAVAVGNFVLTGLQLQYSLGERREIVSQRFTEASIELYGRPEPDEVAALAARELNRVQSYKHNPAVDQERVARLEKFFSSQLQDNDLSVPEHMERSLIEALDQMKEMLASRYGNIAEIFNKAAADYRKLSPEQTSNVFKKAVAQLAEDNPAWNDWSVEVGKTRAMSVNDRKRLISVGSISRATDKLLPLFAHEVLVHAQRAVNGSKLQSYPAEHGMPDYLGAEEGLAKFVQIALSGDRTPVTSDIYMNTGFALGQLGQPQITRTQLQQIYLDKLIVTKQATGAEVDLPDMVSKSWSHVNRIYRGSLGNEVVAVNTKDIAYHKGFLQISSYVQQQIESGMSVEEIFDYLVSAKFDPTNPKHVGHIKAQAVKLRDRQ